MLKLLAILGLVALPFCAETSAQESKCPATDARPTRQMKTIRLKNQLASDVAAALTPFLGQFDPSYNQATTDSETKHDIIITADPKTNSLIIGATPACFNEVVRMIEQIDQFPPSVMIQIVVAKRDLEYGQLDIVNRMEIQLGDNIGALFVMGDGNRQDKWDGIVSSGPTQAPPGITCLHAKIMPGAKVQMRIIPEGRPGVIRRGEIEFPIDGQDFDCTLTANQGETVISKSAKLTERIVTEEKTPWLGDIPVVGRMFCKRTCNVSQSEIFMMLTPYIIYSSEEAENAHRALQQEADAFDCFLRHQRLLRR